jgi:hypothetical protein
MSMSPGEQEPTRDDREGPASEMEAVAEQLVALVEEFEAALSEGQIPPAFAERVAQLRQTAERLI